jgi:hypothetical protein
MAEPRMTNVTVEHMLATQTYWIWMTLHLLTHAVAKMFGNVCLLHCVVLSILNYFFVIFISA